jgi:hypothetical protein
MACSLAYYPLGFGYQLEHTEVSFLIYAVRQSHSDNAVVSDLVVFGFYLLEISINFVLQNKLTLFLPVPIGKIIKAIIQMHHLGYHRVCFCGN